jgi:transposase
MQSGASSVNIYCQDESRLGLQTIARRRLCKKGIKPIIPHQHKFDNFYLFGAFSPINGDSLLLELPYCTTDMFQLFLDELSNYNKEEFKILILDNGSFHHSKALHIPNNIALLFLPPYSPELNPAERVWHFIKQNIAMKAYKNLEELKNDLTHCIQTKINTTRIKSLCHETLYLENYKYIFNV